jgi:hypothetical protein
MASFRADWCLCGGWAVDAWLGHQTREHKDVDIAVFEDELEALRLHFAAATLVAHDTVEQESMEPWDGRRLSLPAHVHIHVGAVELDAQVNERWAGRWLLNREPTVAIETGRAGAATAWGLRAVVPEVLLYYKAAESRREDETDFGALLPRLAPEQVAWLRGAIACTRPGHSWLERLPSGGADTIRT